MALIREKNKLARNEKWKKQRWVFAYIKYRKFLKHLAGTFRRAQTLKLGGVFHEVFGLDFLNFSGLLCTQFDQRGSYTKLLHRS